MSDINSINNIYVFWTNDNISLMTNRIESLENLQKVSKCNIILIDKNNLHKYIIYTAKSSTTSSI